MIEAILSSRYSPVLKHKLTHADHADIHWREWVRDSVDECSYLGRIAMAYGVRNLIFTETFTELRARFAHGPGFD